jgi:hypothetical protein
MSYPTLSIILLTFKPILYPIDRPPSIRIIETRFGSYHAKSFAEKYPSIDYFVEEMGWIEIGDSEMIPSFVKVYYHGGTAYKGAAILI